MVRCPVCESTSVTIVLNSKSHGSCSCCGATWIQEGSWQRAIRPAPVKVEVSAEVITLPEPAATVPAVTEEAVGS